jgi:CHASE2 domain-containing sensor protein
VSSSSRLKIPKLATLEQRLQAVRARRMAIRVSNAGQLALWIAVLGALLVIVSAVVLTFH